VRRHASPVICPYNLRSLCMPCRALMGLSKKNRPSFATVEETTDLTGMTPGGVCPFALPDGLPLFIDEAVLRSGERWGATPGTSGAGDER
jgi:hypothetical protein